MKDREREYILQVPAEPNRLREVLAFVLERAQAMGLSEEQSGRIVLAAEELAVNIIDYAYPGGGGSLEIRCSEKSLDRRKYFCLQLRDRGIPFDPSAAPEPDTRAPARERSAGGLGIHLVRGLADSISYHRREDSNVLTVCFIRQDDGA